jgi:hypothetical protein
MAAGPKGGASKSNALAKPELDKLQVYLRKVLANKTVEVRARQRAADAAELYVGGEFLGVVSKVLDDGETSYEVSMSILDYDLEEDAGS